MDAIITLQNDLEKTAYDGHSSFLRFINNAWRKRRLAHIFSLLPRELRDYIHAFIAADYSRIEVNHFMNNIVDYCKNIEYQRQLLAKEKEFRIISSSPIETVKFEISDKIRDWLLNELSNIDTPLNEVHKLLTKLVSYLQYFENCSDLLTIQNQFNDELQNCGIIETSYLEIMQKANDSTNAQILEETIYKIKRVLQIKREIDKVSMELNTSYRTSEKTFYQKEREKSISTYIQNNIDTILFTKWNRNIDFRQTVRKLASAFAKSKKAFKTFDKMRKDPNNFKEIANLIPIWIMELDDASRIIPLEPNFFDYVILDEASQCNIAYALPIMYRAKKVVFVGDSEQMRDSTITFKSNRDFDELAKRFQIPENQQIKSTGTCVQSVLDIAYQRGFPVKTLRYHYRSPKELIGFCNEYFYKPKGKELFVANNNHLTYKNTNRTMVLHQVKSDWQDEIDDHINVAEASYILTLFRTLRSDEKYKNRSIGILSFFNKQAAYIKDLFEKSGLKEELNNYKVSNIDGVQGDEKDIVIYSFVIRKPEQKNKYIPLTSEGGDINGEVNKGRINVAFSRAREQVHVCISMPPEEVPDKIWIKKYIEYVQTNGVVQDDTLKPFDSYFEETFYNVLCNNLEQSYSVQNQVESCGFKIDFVISNIKTGKRIAIECDGPCHFEDEVDEASGLYVENDEYRQRILESAGWTFFRIKYSNWIDRGFDQKKVISDIKLLID